MTEWLSLFSHSIRNKDVNLELQTNIPTKPHHHTYTETHTCVMTKLSGDLRSNAKGATHTRFSSSSAPSQDSWPAITRLYMPLVAQLVKNLLARQETTV